MNFDKKYGAAAAMVVLLSFVSTSYAAFDENLQGYTLDTILVEADATKDKLVTPLQNNHIIVLAVT